MKAKEFEKTIEEQFQKCREIMIDRAKQYATDDRLHNFKVAAELQCTDPKTALAGMMAKHTVSVYDMCRSNETFSIERWNEKITDHINYLLLLKALIVEEQSTMLASLPTNDGRYMVLDKVPLAAYPTCGNRDVTINGDKI